MRLRAIGTLCTLPDSLQQPPDIFQKMLAKESNCPSHRRRIEVRRDSTALSQFAP